MKKGIRHLAIMTIAASISVVFPSALRAQRHEILSPEIRTLQVVAGQDWLGMPIITIGGGESVNIAFDDMSHSYHRYTYTIEHCEADWSVSPGLFETDYIEGFYNGLTIDDYEESLNTAELYTHYRLQIPNNLCRLKLSGNYRLTVIDDDEGRPVARCCFMVLDRKFGVGLEMTTNTDVGFNKSHQQVNVKLQYNGVSVTDPERQVKGIVMQNNRWSTARRISRAQFRNAEGMAWQHCRDLIFPATNEYRKFEYLDLHRNSMGVDHTDFDGKDYHVWLYTDEPRPNYIYDEDADGAFYIRNTDNSNNDTESEYFVCHFTYKAPVPFDGDVYLNGQWTLDRTLPQYKMEYDPEQGMYHCAVRLKMGYYSYQYLLEQKDGETTVLPSDGNFYQTENRYGCLVYYRPTGGRTDLLYGFGETGR